MSSTAYTDKEGREGKARTCECREREDGEAKIKIARQHQGGHERIQDDRRHGRNRVCDT